MDDYIPELRRQGIVIDHKQEAVPYLLADWKALSKEEKAPFEARAEEWKIATHGRNARPDHEKLNCFGIPVVNQIDYDIETKKNEEIADTVTSEYVDSFLQEGIEILFIAFQSQFDDPDELGFRPMEVCIMSYSLQNGIGNIFHEIMDPGQPPYGMMAEVRQHATQTHHLDPFNPVNGELFLEFVEGNISTVWTKIVDFVSESQIRSDEDREYLLDEENERGYKHFQRQRTDRAS
ncbi:unnamed protein product [Oikopleura dioica]|uniref:Protein maelstrom homolog n=1 Tax=Oikopleura dioica TaxID=34765 RepID=E4YFN6_OIKDI|nr:unnamed protein product [Oikopleura dioica]